MTTKDWGVNKIRPYIDVHCHIGSTVSRAPAVGQSTAKCLGRMASAGVAAAIASPTAGGPQAEGVADTRRQNQGIASACERFPNLTFIGGNPFGGGHGPDDKDHSGAPSDVEIPANVWFDIAQYRSPEDPDADTQLHRIVEFVGSDRILFGSDLPYADFRFVQQEIEKSKLSEEDKDKIAFGNAIRLIRRFRPGWTLPQLPFDSPHLYLDEELWAKRDSPGSPPGYRLA